jgi:alpha-tubulin suppressor-like RCC1 family protein
MQQLNFQPNQGSEEQIDYSSANLYDPFKYDFLDREKVRKVRCGYYHSILITETGKVHYAGNISSGLHLDVLKDEFIVEACGGYEISVFITREGALYVGYLSQEGILGNSQLKKWDIDDHFIAASAGYYHAVFLTKSGDVYTCGQDSYGKLGRGATPTDGHQPMGKINTISNVRTISAGGYHTIMSTRDGLAYGCGHASFGQLGNDFHVEQSTCFTVTNCVDEPRLLDNKIDKGAYIIEIDACGWGSFYIESMS